MGNRLPTIKKSPFSDESERDENGSIMITYWTRAIGTERKGAVGQKIGIVYRYLDNACTILSFSWEPSVLSLSKGRPIEVNTESFILSRRPWSELVL